jgi:hypothetical protein
MSKNALEIISDLNDLDAVRFVQFLGREIFEGVSGKEVVANIPASYRSIPELEKLEKLESDQRKMDLPPTNSIQIARDLLSYFAQDATFGPILETSWEKYEKEDQLFIGAALACGFVASMVLFTATTEIEGKIGNITFKKKVASREIVEAISKAAFDSLRQMLTGI